QQQYKRDKLVTERAPGAATASAGGGPDDTVLLEALGGWLERAWAHPGRAWTQIERTGELFAGDRSDAVHRGYRSSTFDWLGLAVAPYALVYIAAAIGTPADKRKVIAALLEKLVGAMPPSHLLRTMRVHRDEKVED